MLESEADRLEVIKAADGEVVIFDDREIWVIFDNEHEPVTLAGQIVSSTVPMIEARTSDLAEIKVGTSWVVRKGIRYITVDHQPDGTGLSEVFLRLEK